MLGTFPPLLQAVHLTLLLTVIATDLVTQRVPRLWSGVALLTGLATAWLADYPMSHLVAGATCLGIGLYAWQRGQETGTVLGGGDVWVLTYLGLTLGVDAPLAVLLGYLLVVSGIFLGRGEWGQVLPLAGFLAIGALVVLLVPGFSVLALLPVDSAPAAPHIFSVPVSVLPTPTPDPVVIVAAQLSRQAAEVVAAVGLTTPPLRDTQALYAADTLLELAGQTPLPAQATFFAAWVAALRQYAGGHAAALARITQYSACAQAGDYECTE